MLYRRMIYFLNKSTLFVAATGVRLALIEFAHMYLHYAMHCQRPLLLAAAALPHSTVVGNTFSSQSRKIESAIRRDGCIKIVDLH